MTLDAEPYTWEPAPRTPLPAVMLLEEAGDDEGLSEERQQQLDEYEAAKKNVDAAQDALKEQQAEHEQTTREADAEIEAANALLEKWGDTPPSEEAEAEQKQKIKDAEARKNASQQQLEEKQQARREANDLMRQKQGEVKAADDQQTENRVKDQVAKANEAAETESDDKKSLKDKLKDNPKRVAILLALVALSLGAVFMPPDIPGGCYAYTGSPEKLTPGVTLAPNQSQAPQMTLIDPVQWKHRLKFEAEGGGGSGIQKARACTGHVCTLPGAAQFITSPLVHEYITGKSIVKCPTPIPIPASPSSLDSIERELRGTPRWIKAREACLESNNKINTKYTQLPRCVTPIPMGTLTTGQTNRPDESGVGTNPSSVQQITASPSATPSSAKTVEDLTMGTLMDQYSTFSDDTKIQQYRRLSLENAWACQNWVNDHYNNRNPQQQLCENAKSCAQCLDGAMKHLCQWTPPGKGQRPILECENCPEPAPPAAGRRTGTCTIQAAANTAIPSWNGVQDTFENHLVPSMVLPIPTSPSSAPSESCDKDVHKPYTWAVPTYKDIQSADMCHAIGGKWVQPPLTVAHQCGWGCFDMSKDPPEILNQPNTRDYNVIDYEECVQDGNRWMPLYFKGCTGNCSTDFWKQLLGETDDVLKDAGDGIRAGFKAASDAAEDGLCAFARICLKGLWKHIVGGAIILCCCSILIYLRCWKK